MAKIGSKLQKLQVYRVNKRYLCSNQRATGFTLSEPAEPAGSRAVYLSNFTKFFEMYRLSITPLDFKR
jgi:hypothetical protein